MSSAAERGRQAALKVKEFAHRNQAVAEEEQPIDFSPIVEALSKLDQKPIDFSPIVEAILELEQEGLDVNPIVAAIKGLNLESNVDVSVDVQPLVDALQALADKGATDFTPVVDKLDSIRQAVTENTKVLRELVKVAKSSKIVKYDAMGRISEIKVTKVK